MVTLADALEEWQWKPIIALRYGKLELIPHVEMLIIDGVWITTSILRTLTSFGGLLSYNLITCPKLPSTNNIISMLGINFQSKTFKRTQTLNIPEESTHELSSPWILCWIVLYQMKRINVIDEKGTSR